jgi:hypothetical protein
MVNALPGAGKALVLVPEGMNHFNTIAGRRVVEALTRLGWDARLLSLRRYHGEVADLAVLVSLAEMYVTCDSERQAVENIFMLKHQCPTVMMWLLEPTRTPWFENAFFRMRSCELSILADNALHSQLDTLTPEQRPFYHHLFYGLTEREKEKVRALPAVDPERPIPWVYVGWKVPERVALARFLLDEVDRRGFLYLSDVQPITETGPHLKDAAYQRVLERCRYHLWRAHHAHFYMEGERYRRSALAGCVPVKIIEEDRPGDLSLPFPYLVVPREGLRELLNAERFQEVRRRFLDEYLALPSLEDELARFLPTVRPPAAQAA